MDPELIADYACVTGEGPLWHPLEKRIYWLDIPQGRMFRYDPATGRHEQVHEGAQIGGATVQADGSLLLFMEKGAVAKWSDGEIEHIVGEIPEERDSRFNDVIADPAGRVFCGTMSTAERSGRLYRLDIDGSITLILEDVGTSNGMGFTADRKHMYHTDTDVGTIFSYDYDERTGDISNRRIFLKIEDDGGRPDGMTVDADGHVWSARWDGHHLVQHRPDGTEERRIRFPAKKVSSVTFGGADLTDIYVTTAGGQDKGGNGPGAGALFRVNLGIRGMPEFYSRVRL